MIDLDVFLPKIMPFAPGCPEPTALGKIILAAQAFSERTRLWRDSDQFSVTPTSCNVVCAPAGADVFEIESAWLDDYELTPISLADLEHKHPTWRQYSQGSGKWITQVDMDTVMVVPSTTGTLKLSTILRPSEGAEQLPDFMHKHYSQCIADGALAEILMLPTQPFTDPERAQFFLMRFENKLSELARKSIRGQQRAPVRTRASWF